jgi:deoxyxylulose-5-phosphate synthase
VQAKQDIACCEEKFPGLICRAISAQFMADDMIALFELTLEEGAIMGGAGSAVTEALAAAGVVCPVLQLGLPDRFIDHGEQGALLASVGLDAAGIESSVRARFEAYCAV